MGIDLNDLEMGHASNFYSPLNLMDDEQQVIDLNDRGMHPVGNHVLETVVHVGHASSVSLLLIQMDVGHASSLSLY